MPTAPTTIIHIVREAHGGMRKHVLTLLRHTDRAAFQLRLIASRRFLGSADNQIPEDVERLEASIGDSIGLAGLVSLPAIVKSIKSASALRLIHAHGYTAGLVGAAASRMAGAPFIYTAHNMLAADAPLVIRAAARTASRRTTRIIAVSKSVERSLERIGVKQDKIRVIPGGVEPFDAPASFDRSAKLEELGLPSHSRVVLCVARLTPVKGVRYLIEAMPAVKQSVPDAVLVVAGDGPERRELEGLDRCGTVFLGHRTDVPEMLLAADVVAIPSVEEGQGLLLLEAMSAGRPVVASNVGGLAETIDDGATGLLVPPKDPAALAAAIASVLTDDGLALRLGTTAREFVAREMSVERMIDQTQELYLQCAG